MAYKRVDTYDPQDMIDHLAQIRKTVSDEKKKRLEQEQKKKTIVPTYKSGQEFAKKRRKT